MEFMWKIFSKIPSTFITPKPVIYSTDIYEEVLFSESDVKEVEDHVVEEGPGSVCQRRTGKITRVEPTYGLIDDKFYFEIAELNQKNVKAGQAVKYIAYRSNPNVEWRVKQVNILEEDGWVENENVLQESKVTSEAVAVEKTVTAVIVKRNGRDIVMDPGNLQCNLDRVKAEFLPVEGDWVSLTAIVELREDENLRIHEHVIEVLLLKPLRQRRFDGRVSCVRVINEFEVEGTVNSEVYFHSNVCEPGYTPANGDLVVVHCIESTQGSLVWRAIAVNVLSSQEVDSTFLAKIKEERLFDSKNGISVTEACDKKSIMVGEITLFRVTVENAGDQTQVLLKTELKNSKQRGVMRIVSCMEDEVPIPPSTSYVIEIEAEGKFYGYFSDVLILYFEGDLKIGCMLDIYVDVEEKYKSKCEISVNTRRQSRSASHLKRIAALKKLVPTKTGFIVPGVRPVKPTSFLPKQLDHFIIPENLKRIVIGDCPDAFRTDAEIEIELQNMLPYMMEELNDQNYLMKFHSLLHLEDLELLLIIKKYDQDRVSFTRRGEYLVLEIPNLAESRPSLIIGDKVLVSDPAVFNKEGGIKYEGYIHRVLANSIKLKFNDSFHNAYDGKDYTVSFIHSRTSIRRCHQALNEVFKHLGKSFLFPNTLGCGKTSQVSIVGEYPLPNPQPLDHQCEDTSKDADEAAQNSVLPQTTNIIRSGSTKKRMTLTDFSIEESESEELAQITKADDASISTSKVETKPHSYASLNTYNTKEVIIKWEDKKRPDFRRGTEELPNRSRETSGTCRPRDVIVKWVNLMLNHYQREAVRNILKGVARPLPYIIFGPPGTGKTVTVVETVLQIMYLMPESRILIATPSNSSADLICERLLSWKLLKSGDLVRLVGYNYMMENRMSPQLKPYCTCLDTKNTDKSTDHTSYDEEGIKFSTRQVIGRHRITVTTCVTVGSLYMMGFPKDHFTHIIIDEAGQATEPEIMIPLAFLSHHSQAILAGDPRQLGPVIMSRVADMMGLGESLLSRLLIRFPYHRDPESYPDTDGYDPRLVTRLLYNYRSLPNILSLYSSLFYDSKLISQICDKCSIESKILNQVKDAIQEDAWHKVSEVIFHGVKGINLQEEDSPSWFNDHEIARVVRYISSLYSCGLKSDDIGIITPYQKQVFKLRETLRVLQLDTPKVGTVEEFQGQERNVIILSTVRSDEGLLTKDSKFALGFVSSKQRLNVAISRARAVLIIVGNPHLLAKDIAWRNLLRILKRRECCVGCDLPACVD